jgi:hypothetical protein
MDIYLLDTNPIRTNIFLSLPSPYYPVRYDPDYTDMIDIDILDTPSLSISVYLYSLHPNVAFSLPYIFLLKSECPLSLLNINRYITDIPDIAAKSFSLYSLYIFLSKS